MLDLKWIRENPVAFQKGLERRKISGVGQAVLDLDKAWREKIAHTQQLQTEKNALAKKVAEAKREGANAEHLMVQALNTREKLGVAESETQVLKDQLDVLLASLPNMLDDTVPAGEDESNNITLKTWGELPSFSFSPEAHEILGRKLDQMDFEAAARMSGSRFVVLKGDLARLERALAQFMLDTHTQNFQYLEVSPPYLVNEASVYGVGQLPKFSHDLFATTDGRWLISTAEVSLTNLVKDQILDPADLPLRYTAYTPCFRSEAGAAGKDTRGMVRLHQFSKVELVHITTPETSEQEYEYLCDAAETLLQLLKLPYRVVALCAGDMGFAARKTRDLEVWLPSQKTYREISSCSHFGDFQARRMGAKMRCKEKGTLNFVHTLNGSGLPVGRTLVAILENYQQNDGSILIPEVLRVYMGGQQIIEKR